MPIIENPVDFFYEHAGYGYDPAKETPEGGRRRGAELLAAAEEWAREVKATFEWSDDWSVDHQKEYDCYAEGGPETCEAVTMLINDEIVGGLGCVDDATDEYRRVVEAELALDAMPITDDHLVRSEN